MELVYLNLLLAAISGGELLLLNFFNDDLVRVNNHFLNKVKVLVEFLEKVLVTGFYLELFFFYGSFGTVGVFLTQRRLLLLKSSISILQEFFCVFVDFWGVFVFLDRFQFALALHLRTILFIHTRISG